MLYHIGYFFENDYFCKKNELKLVIDIGNTLAKVAIFEKNQIMHISTYNNIKVEQIQNILKSYSIDKSIISSVKQYPIKIRDILIEKSFFIELSETTKLPVVIKYSTKETLGKDRLAAVVGANNIYPNSNVLVINAGTCITYDFIDKNSKYYGGAISPGIQMRLKALNTFTEKLPLIKSKKKVELIGNSTQNSILSGVMNGVVYEVNGFIESYRKNYDDLKVILSGGDMNYFDKKFKNCIFAFSNIVINGLNIILDFNA